MRVDQDIKLDFKDVLFRPKRSTLKSRSQVTLEKTYTFRNSGVTWTGVPIIGMYVTMKRKVFILVMMCVYLFKYFYV